MPVFEVLAGLSVTGSLSHVYAISFSAMESSTLQVNARAVTAAGASARRASAARGARSPRVRAASRSPRGRAAASPRRPRGSSSRLRQLQAALKKSPAPGALARFGSKPRSSARSPAARGSSKSGNTGIVPPSILSRIGASPHARSPSSRSSKPGNTGIVPPNLQGRTSRSPALPGRRSSPKPGNTGIVPPYLQGASGASPAPRGRRSSSKPGNTGIVPPYLQGANGASPAPRGRRSSSKPGNTGIVPPYLQGATGASSPRRSSSKPGNTGIVPPALQTRAQSRGRGRSSSRAPPSVQHAIAGATGSGSLGPVQMRSGVAALESSSAGARISPASPKRSASRQRALPSRSLGKPVETAAVAAAAVVGAPVSKDLPLPKGLGRVAGRAVPAAELPGHKKATALASKWAAKGVPADVITKKLHSVSKERFDHKMAQGKRVMLDADVARKLSKGKLAPPPGAALSCPWTPPRK